MTVAAERIDRAFEAFLPFLSAQPELAREFETSVATFFHGQPGGHDARDTLLAARRHLEWFTLENTSRTLSEIPILAQGEAWLEPLEPDAVHRDELWRCLRDSHCGVYEVTGVQPGEGAWLRDLAGFGEYPVAEAMGAEILEPGDLIVGRLFPLGEGLFHISRAAGFYRNAELRAALQRDLSRARDERGGKVLHIAQAELEAMFWRGDDSSSEVEEVGDPEQELRELLQAAGVDPARSESWLGRLAATPFDPSRLVHGSRDAMGEILDELAFETAVDLERARQLLVRVWSRSARVLGPAGRRKSVASKDVDVRAAVEAFDKGRAAGADLEQLFQALEEDLDLEPDREEDDAPVPDFPGVVGAMVEEFLWEVGEREGQDKARRYAVLAPLGRYGASVGTFENLGADDLVRFSCFWMLEERSITGNDQAQAMLEALRAFCEWAQEAHEVSLWTDFASTWEGLAQSLPRVVAANDSLGLAARDTSDTGELLVFTGVREGVARVRDGEGQEHDVRMAERLLDFLESEDPLRGRVQFDGSLSVFCCYPPQALRLLVS